MADSEQEGRPERATSIVEHRGSGAMMVGMIVIIALIAAVAFFLFSHDKREERRTEAVIGAAESVSDSARDAGSAISGAVERQDSKPD